jgi:hypothetical protein
MRFAMKRSGSVRAVGDGGRGEKRNSLFGRLNNLGTAGEQRRRLPVDSGMIK